MEWTDSGSRQDQQGRQPGHKNLEKREAQTDQSNRADWLEASVYTDCLVPPVPPPFAAKRQYLGMDHLCSALENHFIY